MKKSMCTRSTIPFSKGVWQLQVHTWHNFECWKLILIIIWGISVTFPIWMTRFYILLKTVYGESPLILHTMDMLWEKFQWIIPLYMKPISFQSKASIVCSVTAAVFIDFCLKKLNVFSQHIGQKTNEYLNFTEQIPRNWNVDQLSMLITS